MTDTRTPLDAALDLVVYAPLGLALTISEELPKLAAKGRTTLTSRVTTARLVGQFAVTQGRREVERRLGPKAPPAAGTAGPAAPPAPRPAAPSTPARPAGAPAAAPGPSVAAPSSTTSATPSAASSRPAAPSAPRRTPAASPDRSSITAAAGAPAPGDLAITGYDSLSASQVVQRLAGLSAAELDSVKSYEASHRGRRTVLARISQLQA